MAAKLIAALGHQKAKLWVNGRKNIWTHFPISRIPNPESAVAWFHFASLGEYEQGRPLMEQLKAEQTDLIIVATFFSPSGYEYCKDTKLIDHKFYLPADTLSNAKKFIEYIKPNQVFFVKYEFWYHYLEVLYNNKIPVYLVSGLFRPNQIFFKWYGGLHRKMLSYFTHFFVQNENSKKLLQSLHYHNITVTGDTRYDRCLQIANTPYTNEIIQDFVGDTFCIVAGSTWAEDESLFVDLSCKIIIAPHDISRSESLYKQISNAVLYSNYNNNSDKQILIIDNIGMLSNIYRFASIAYVGGAFGKGLHNIIEPLSHGKSVIFGPKTNKFPEAAEAIEQGVAHQIQHTSELYNIVERYISDEVYLKEQQKQAKAFAVGNEGAVWKVMEQL